MIDQLHIRHFKCINDVRLSLAPVTLLTGVNGMGKSSALQSLLLLQQSSENHSDLHFPSLTLNGRYADIGNAKDALWEGSDDDQLSLGFSVASQEYTWTFLSQEGSNELLADIQIVPSMDISKEIGLFSSQFHYMRAARFGPQLTFPLSDTAVRHRNEIGFDGEHAPYFLSLYGRKRLHNEHLVHGMAESEQLQHQLEAWMGEISPSTRVHTQQHNDIDLVSLAYSFTTESGETNAFRSVNVGFGVTYTLPVVLRLLSAEPNSLILLENPEAHLHPKGQAKMGELIALTALGGVQIIVETHSDHLLNGIRVAVHAGKIHPGSVCTHFFERQHKGGTISAKVVSPQIDSNGRFNFWPEGFFDESEKALRQLLSPPEKMK